jgi:hypothetical protein
MNGPHADYHNEPTTREEALVQAYLKGRGGYFALPTNTKPTGTGVIAPSSFTIQDAYVTLDMPDWASRRFLITAAQMRYQTPQTNGYGPGTPLTAIYPPDNQVNAGGAGNVTFRQTLRIEYGVSGAREVVRVDYPWGGATYAVQAASLRVYLDQAFMTGTDNVPMMGAWAAPVDADPGALPPPTLTTAVINIPAGPSSADFPVPARARGFMLYFDTFAAYNTYATGPNTTLTQKNGQGAAVAFSHGSGAPGPGAGIGNDPVAESSFFPLHPAATVVTVTNIGAVGSFNMGIRWLIGL